MSEDTKPAAISKKVLVYRISGMDDVKVQRDVEYSVTDECVLTLDIYYPPDSPESGGGARLPAVVFVAGFTDAGFEANVGCKFKEMASNVSWGRLTAASGLAAITYTNREPATDLSALLRHVRHNAGALGIDADRIGLWASSGNVPLALSALMQEDSEYLKCAVLCYGYTLDLEGSSGVCDAARMWGFANPCAGRGVNDLPRALPLFIARAGQDALPRLNETLDRFLCAALAHNLPVTFVNHADAPHAFDLLHDSETSRQIIKHILAFLRFHLLRSETTKAHEDTLS
ncbi:MAG TPA: alpha/beta hydrolase [Pyrinomonadaceae bacterium]|nr:alpha/beta hydrolase [Pyrinomonadaceae bacterium]